MTGAGRVALLRPERKDQHCVPVIRGARLMCARRSRVWYRADLSPFIRGLDQPCRRAHNDRTTMRRSRLSPAIGDGTVCRSTSAQWTHPCRWTPISRSQMLRIWGRAQARQAAVVAWGCRLYPRKISVMNYCRLERGDLRLSSSRMSHRWLHRPQ